MFTGIVQAVISIIHIEERTGLKTLSFALTDELVRGLKFGSSISIAGVCVTVSQIHGNTIAVDIMMETLKKTTLGALRVGDKVNIERSARYGDEVGGHPMSGHVHTTVEIIAIDQPENNSVITFRVTPQWTKYIFSKGFIGLDGTSLTVVDVNKKQHTFQVWFIPETLRVTTFGDVSVGGRVNMEIDQQTLAIVDTIERIMAEKDAHE